MAGIVMFIMLLGMIFSAMGGYFWLTLVLLVAYLTLMVVAEERGLE